MIEEYARLGVLGRTHRHEFSRAEGRTPRTDQRGLHRRERPRTASKKLGHLALPALAPPNYCSVNPFT